MAFPMIDIIQEDGERAIKMVGFCSLEGELRLGGRRRVAAAENGWGTNALWRRVKIFIDGWFREKEVGVRESTLGFQ
jgi:hypothetical protein